ncbi:Non-reducing polyketide synthase Preu3 [Dirofilaria immitis]
MEPHPWVSAVTTFTTLSSSTIDISFDSTTTAYYTVIPISYAIDMNSDIPYRDVIMNEDNVSSEQLSQYFTDTCSKASNANHNLEELSDDNSSNNCNESTAETLQLHFPLSADNISRAEGEIQQLSSSSSPESNTAALRTNLESDVAAQRLPLSSILKSNFTAERLPLASNLQRNTAIRSLPLHFRKSLQATDDFQQKLPFLRKIRLLNDKATHHARLAQDAWEEARMIAASLNMPPPTLPDAVDFMSYSYTMNRRMWDLSKISGVQRKIEPALSQVINQENLVPSSSILQSIPTRIKPSAKLISPINSVLNSNSNQLPFKISWMKKNACRFKNAKLTKNITAEMIDQQSIVTSPQSSQFILLFN